MEISIVVFDAVRIKDIFGSIFKAVVNTLPFSFYFADEAKEKEAEQQPVDNNSPPETLGIGITEQVNTKEALS